MQKLHAKQAHAHRPPLLAFLTIALKRLVTKLLMMFDRG